MHGSIQYEISFLPRAVGGYVEDLPGKLNNTQRAGFSLENTDGVCSWKSSIMVDKDMFIPFDQYHIYGNVFLNGLWQENFARLH